MPVRNPGGGGGKGSNTTIIQDGGTPIDLSDYQTVLPPLGPEETWESDETGQVDAVPKKQDELPPLDPGETIEADDMGDIVAVPSTRRIFHQRRATNVNQAFSGSGTTYEVPPRFPPVWDEFSLHRVISAQVIVDGTSDPDNDAPWKVEFQNADGAILATISGYSINHPGVWVTRGGLHKTTKVVFSDQGEAFTMTGYSITFYSTPQPVSAAPDVDLGAQGETLVVGPDGVITEPPSAGAGGVTASTVRYRWELDAAQVTPGFLWVDADNNVWVPETESTRPADIYVYNTSGVLLARYDAADVSLGTSLWSDGTTLWVCDILGSTHAARAYEVPDVSAAGDDIRDLTRKSDFDIPIGNLSTPGSIGGEGTLIAIVGVRGGNNRVERWNVGTAGVTATSAFNMLNSRGPSGMVIDGTEYFSLMDQPTGSGTVTHSAIHRAPLADLMAGQGLYLTLQSADGVNKRSRGLSRQGGVWRSIERANNEVVSYDDEGRELESGDVPAATTGFPGLVQLAADADLEPGGLTSETLAVTPAGIDHVIVGHELADEDRIDQAIEEAHQLAWESMRAGIQLGRPPTSLSLYGLDNFGRASFNPHMALASDIDANFYVCSDRQVWTADPVTGTLLSQIGSNTILPDNAESAAYLTGTLYVIGSQRRLMAVDIAAGTAAYVGAANSTAGVLVAHRRKLYLVASGGIAEVDPADGSATLHTGNLGSASLVLEAAVSYLGNLWLLDSDTEVWIRISDDHGVITTQVQAGTEVPVTWTSNLANTDTMVEWRGRIYSTHSVSGAGRLGRM